MKKYKLGEIASHITDGEHGSISDDMQGAYYLLSNKNIVDGNIVITNDDRKISQESFLKINKRTLLDLGDIIISTVGTLGKVAIIKNKPNYDFQRSVGIIKPNGIVNTEYLYYFLQQPIIQKKLSYGSTGAIQKCIFIDQLKNFEIEVCSNFKEQQKIATLLSALDRKIAVNRQINRNLA